MILNSEIFYHIFFLSNGRFISFPLIYVQPIKFNCYENSNSNESKFFFLINFTFRYIIKLLFILFLFTVSRNVNKS